jgi:hypothetical protein
MAQSHTSGRTTSQQADHVHTAANRHQAKATDVGRARPHLGVEGVINSASYMTRVNSTFGIASEGLAIVEGRAEP